MGATRHSRLHCYMIETALSVWLGFVGTGSDFIPPIASDGPLPFMWPRAATPTKFTLQPIMRREPMPLGLPATFAYNSTIYR